MEEVVNLSEGEADVLNQTDSIVDTVEIGGMNTTEAGDDVLFGIAQYSSEEEQEEAKDLGKEDVINDEEETPLRIVEGGLNFVLKNFDDLGDFYGLIISYDEPFFKVVYEDGDCEELEYEEAERLQVAITSVPERTVTTLKKIAKSMSQGRSASAALEQEQACPVSVTDKEGLGWEQMQTFVLKSFGDLGDFHGLIIGYEKPFYKVVYEDGDCEELTLSEVKACKVPEDDVSAYAQEQLRAYASSTTSAASPTAFTASTSRGSGGKKKDKKHKREKEKTKADKKRNRTQYISEEEVEEEAEAKESLSLGDEVMAGKCFLLKSFGDLGDFHGLVIGFSKPFYKVVYEDGDCEELTLSEVKACKVPEDDVSAYAQEQLRAYASSTTSAASPTAFTASTSRGSGGKKKDKKHKREKEKTKADRRTSGGGKAQKRPKTSVSATPSFLTPPGTESVEAVASAQEVHVLLSNVTEEKECKLQEPVDTYDNYVSKTFFGFGVFYGLLVSCKLPYYKILYTDGDSEELSSEEVLANLTNPEEIPTNIKNQLRTLARAYRKNPDPYKNEPAPPTITEDPPPNNTYRDVPDDNLYQQYVGRTFIDLDEYTSFRVKSVCLHMDYDVLLFKYYDVNLFTSNPEMAEDPEKYEYSACSEMLRDDSWCRWEAEGSFEPAVGAVATASSTVTSASALSPAASPCAVGIAANSNGFGAEGDVGETSSLIEKAEEKEISHETVTSAVTAAPDQSACEVTKKGEEQVRTDEDKRGEEELSTKEQQQESEGGAEEQSPIDEPSPPLPYSPSNPVTTPKIVLHTSAPSSEAKKE